MGKYSLVGIDGNAFNVMAYTRQALLNEGLSDDIPEMLKKAKSGNYDNLIYVCNMYIEKANVYAHNNGYQDE